jgi:hypothetical protein
VGDKSVPEILYAGRVPDSPGVDQVVFRLPEDAPEGCSVPVQARTGNDAYSNIVSMAIDAGGAPCTERLGSLARTVLTGGRVGLVELLRLSLRATLRDGQAVSDIPAIDLGEAAFFQGAADDPGLNPVYSRPPVGMCSGAPPISVLDALLLPGAYGKTLHAGPAISVSGPDGRIDLKPQTGFPDEYYALLGGQDVLRDGAAALPLFLNGGQYTVSGPGGRDVGAFSRQLGLAPAITWTNRDALADIDRSAGVTVEWSGGDGASQVALIFGGASAGTSGGGFLCVADLAAGSFTVPPRVLATVPAVSGQAALAGAIMLGAIPAGDPPVTFSAPGIDLGYVLSTALHIKQVGFH